MYSSMPRAQGLLRFERPQGAGLRRASARSFWSGCSSRKAWKLSPLISTSMSPCTLAWQPRRDVGADVEGLVEDVELFVFDVGGVVEALGHVDVAGGAGADAAAAVALGRADLAWRPPRMVCAVGDLDLEFSLHEAHLRHQRRLRSRGAARCRARACVSASTEAAARPASALRDAAIHAPAGKALARPGRGPRCGGGSRRGRVPSSGALEAAQRALDVGALLFVASAARRRPPWPARAPSRMRCASTCSSRRRRSLHVLFAVLVGVDQHALDLLVGEAVAGLDLDLLAHAGASSPRPRP